MTRITVLLLLVCAVVVGQDVKPIEVIGPAKPILENAWEMIPVNNLTEAESESLSISIEPNKDVATFQIKGAPVFFFRATKPGKYVVTVGKNVQHAEWQRSLSLALSQQKAVNVPADLQVDLEKYIAKSMAALPARGGSCVVEVAGSTPLPPEPNPPNPPSPTPGDNPFPAAGLRVLILEETNDRPKIPQPQQAIFASTALKSVLNRSAARDGDRLEYRLWDDDFTDVELKAGGINEMWRNAYKRAQIDSAGNTPWVIVSDGTKFESKALPGTEAEMLELLKKYGGN